MSYTSSVTLRRGGRSWIAVMSYTCSVTSRLGGRSWIVVMPYTCSVTSRLGGRSWIVVMPYTCSVTSRRGGRSWIVVMSYTSSVTCSFCLAKFKRMVALSVIVEGSSSVVDAELRVPGLGLVVAVATLLYTFSPVMKVFFFEFCSRSLTCSSSLEICSSLGLILAAVQRFFC